MNCPSCGAENAAEARVCATCGTALSPEPTPTEPLVTPSGAPATEPLTVAGPTEPLGPGSPAPPVPPGPFAPQPAPEPTSLGAGWGTAIRWSGAAFAAILILGLVVGVGVGLVSEGDLSVPDTLRLSGLYVSLFHHTPVVVEVAGRGGAGLEPLSPVGALGGGVEIGLALGLATTLGAFLLFRGGRAVAERAGGSRLVRGLHGLKVAPLYGVLALLVSFLASFRFDVPGNPVFSGVIRIHPSYLGAVIWPLAIAAVAGFAGGLTSPRPDPGQSAWSQRIAAAAGGGWRMFGYAIMLSFVGFLVVAAVHPNATRAYFRGIAEAGARDGTVLLTHHVLLLPNQSMWILVPAMGGCDTADAGVGGFRLSTNVLCYWQFPGAGEGGEVPSGPFAFGEQLERNFGTAPVGYFLFLLVPLLATVLGGRWAAGRTGATERTEAVVSGILAGVAFALLVGAGILLSRITVSLSSGSAQLGQAGGATIGPNLLTGTGLALMWGAVGGAVGGLIATRRGSTKRNEPG